MPPGQEHPIRLGGVCHECEPLPVCRADFAIAHTDDRLLVIVDVGPWHSRPTVTNDAEAVIAELHRRGVLGKRRLIYRDSDRRWDELTHDGAGKFKGFAALPACFRPPLDLS